PTAAAIQASRGTMVRCNRSGSSSSTTGQGVYASIRVQPSSRSLRATRTASSADSSSATSASRMTPLLLQLADRDERKESKKEQEEEREEGDRAREKGDVDDRGPIHVPGRRQEILTLRRHDEHQALEPHPG